jgi:hypothetical protein
MTGTPPPTFSGHVGQRTVNPSRWSSGTPKWPSRRGKDSIEHACSWLSLGQDLTPHVNPKHGFGRPTVTAEQQDPGFFFGPGSCAADGERGSPFSRSVRRSALRHVRTATHCVAKHPSNETKHSSNEMGVGLIVPGALYGRGFVSTQEVAEHRSPLGEHFERGVTFTLRREA